MRWTLALWIGLSSGCVAHVRGMLPPEGEVLLTPEGKHVRLVIDASHGPELHYARGLLLDVSGHRSLTGLKVEGWGLNEGSHGLQAWWGLLRAGEDGQLVLIDAQTHLPYQLQIEATPVLSDWVGRPVLLEGYLEDTFAVQVVYYRPLFEVR